MKLDALTFIEAPETGKTIRLLKWGIDVWKEEGKIRIFDRPHLYTSYPGLFCLIPMHRNCCGLSVDSRIDFYYTGTYFRQKSKKESHAQATSHWD